MSFLLLLSRSCESFLIANGEEGARLILQNIFSMLQTKLSQRIDHVDYDWFGVTSADIELTEKHYSLRKEDFNRIKDHSFANSISTISIAQMLCRSISLRYAVKIFSGLNIQPKSILSIGSYHTFLILQRKQHLRSNLDIALGENVTQQYLYLC